MRFIVNGAPREALTAEEMRKAEPAGRVYAGSGEVLAPAELARQSRRGCLIGIGVVAALIWAVFLINLRFADPEIDNSGFRILVAGAGIVVPLGLYLFSFSAQARVDSQSTRDYSEAPSPGTRIGVDDAGLLVGDRRFGWDQVAIERLELQTTHTEDDDYLTPRAMIVSTPAGEVFISELIVEHGIFIMRELHRRLWPQTLAALRRGGG